MRSPLNLAGWIVLLGILELSSLLLDRTHHLIWGRAGLFLLKASYLAFATVLLVRFLSFRTRKPFESMLESYNRIAERPWNEVKSSGSEWRKLAFHMALVVVASTNFLTPILWREMAFKASILLDLAFWSLALRWVVRAYWLKSLGRREKLKEGLDDARSRLRTGSPMAPPTMGKASALPFIALFIVAVSITGFLSLERWRKASQVYWVGTLKACLLDCLDASLVRFHGDGRLDVDLAKAPCLAPYRSILDAGIGFQRGEIRLWAVEKPKSDFFGNGRAGDQGMQLDAAGRFRTTGRRR